MGIFGYPVVFIVAGVAALLSAVTAFCIAPPNRTQPQGMRSIIRGIREPHTIRYAFVLFLINTALPTAGLLLLGMFDFQSLILVLGISAVLSALTAIGSASGGEEPGHRDGNVLKTMVEPSALLPSSILFLMNAAYPAAVLFIPLYARSLAVEQVAIFFLAQGVVSVATQGGLGRLSDKIGRVPAIAIGLIGAVVGLLLLAGATNLLVLSAGGAIFMFGFGMINPALFAMVMDRAPREKLGAATATFTISFQAGKAVGSFVGGYLIALLSFQSLYVLSAIPLAAAFVVIFVLRDKFAARPKSVDASA
jgi:predicted MFS family arabinose efflux permease